MAERKYYRKTYQKKRKRKKISFLLRSIFFFFLIIIFSFISLFFYYAKDFPRPEKFTERQLIQPTKIYDRTGEVLLYSIYGEEKRIVIPLEKVPTFLKQAIIVAEDANFYKHYGIDLKGIARAILINLKLRKPVQGASTISQQLIRSSFLTMEKSFERKIKEIILTLELERRYSKDQILEFYLNQVPFGRNSYGIEAASESYFNKPVEQLSLAEAATLAALVKAPSYLSPDGPHKEELTARKNYILDRMAELNFITEEETQKTKNQQLEFAKTIQMIKAPHFVMYIKDYLEKYYGQDFLKEKGLKIYTTLDWELQKTAEQIVEEGVKNNIKYHAYNASLVAINPKTGEILTMVGSADYFATSSYPKGCKPGENCLFEPEVNVATFGLGRQPGSAFKPFAYAEAFKKGYTPETVLWDVKTEFNPNCSENANQEKDKYGLDCYHPENYDRRFRGTINLKNSLAQSINITSVKVLYLAGIEQTISLAKTFGITTLDRPLSWYGLSLVLGGGEIKLLDITSAYGVFATRGFKVPPVFILKIVDSKGNIIEENKKTPQKVLESQVADIINDILSDNNARTPVFGPRSQLYFEDYNVAAKTGTTENFKDGWTIGYTPSIVIGVWAGNNNNEPMNKEPGVNLAGPIWHQFMEVILKKGSKETFQKPKPISIQKPILNGVIDWENLHTILYYIDKDNPRGNPPQNPELDPQYKLWEKGIKNWIYGY